MASCRLCQTRRLLAFKTTKNCRIEQRLISKAANATTSSVLNYNIEMVRNNDYENYLCLLRLPEEARMAAFGIRAFNVELAKIKDNVSDKHIGSMRLQFWTDIIHEIYEGKSRAHPVVFLLFDTIKKHKLTKNWFMRLITARENGLDNKPYMTLKEIEDYGENSTSSVLYLILESLGIRDVRADHVVSHIGKAIALSVVLRAMTFNAQARRVFLPVELLMKHKISQEEILRQMKPEVTAEIVFEIASQAHIHLEKARSMRMSGSISNQALKVCLAAVPCASYLERIRKSNFNAFDPRLQQRDWTLPINILLKSWTSSF